jgi:IclR family transcriptional regulator, acetate operon repressor
MKKSDCPAHPIQSVENALMLLELFSERRRLSIGAIATHIGIAPSSASRLVSMLEHHGYVRREEDSRDYILGARLRDLGLNAVRELDIRPQTRPYLEVLAAETGETIQMGILQGQYVIFIDCIEGHHNLRVSSRVGSLLPAHCLSTGKALLADALPDDVKALYPREHLQQLTPKTISSATKLRRTLDDVRRRGYASSFSESEIGVSTVAVSIRDVAGRTRCALSLAAPESRLTAKNAEMYAKMLRRSAKAIAATLL